ncbi:protein DETOXIFICATION 27-like [Phragmites australis]|uniref:protein DETOXIFICATION 27-like n=1 Tax=Phragmites australis TaxID=29695 RepID=UPI002D77A2A3|nr:protein DETOXIFICATION 27-like [Phragmites australis]
MESQSAVPLISELPLPEKRGGGKVPGRLAKEVWEESKKLWDVVGPAVFMRLVIYSMNIVSQAFVGHLGDRDLAAFSIANTVVDGLNFGFLFGMASALETLCGQAYGARQYPMLGIYLQRSWLILLAFAVLLAPTYVFSGQLLAALGQPTELAREAGLVSLYMLPSLFMYAILLPVITFLQCQLKNRVTAVATAVVFPVHVAATWLLVHYFGLGVLGAALAFNLSWVLYAVLQLAYALGGGCPETWSGFSASAFAFVDLKEFVKLSASSGVMVCLENWYYRILIFLTGYMKNAELAVDALSICMSLSGWEMMIHLGFLAGTGVRVANELGAANGQGARFAAFVSTTTSFFISLFFSLLTLIFHDKLAIIFSSSEAVIDAVDDISVLLALTILLNGVQPVLSGVAVGSGWQALVAYVNIGSYYLIGIPFGVLLGWPFHYGVYGVWVGMICGTTMQTLILAWITLRCDWSEEALKASNRIRQWGST